MSNPNELQQRMATLALELVLVMRQMGSAALELDNVPGDGDTAFTITVKPVGHPSSGMTLNEYQRHALRTAPAEGANHFFSFAAQLPQAEAAFRPNIDLVHAAFGMAGESGELVDLVKKSMFYGKPFSPDKAIKEAGDCLWYIAGPFCRAMGITFEQLAAVNVAKLQERYQGTYTDKAAIARPDVNGSN